MENIFYQRYLFALLDPIFAYLYPDLNQVTNPNTSTQTNEHRDTLAQKKKKKKNTERYTNTPTHKQTQTNKQQRGRSVLIRMIGA